jgi:hypothetical protein
MYTFFFLFPFAAIVITFIRNLSVSLPIEGTALEFQFKTLPLLAYTACLLMTFLTWWLSISKEPTTDHLTYGLLVSGWVVGALIIWIWSPKKKTG